MTRPYLCQPSHGERSCGACCGLYNFKDRSLDALTERLTKRTKIVGEICGARDSTPGQDIRARLSLWATEEHQHSIDDLLVRELPTCHFVGFLSHGGVGCLLHPKVTGGDDLRDLGVYQDKNICEGFLCPSFEWLRDEELSAILSATLGWYDYGLTVTDVELLRAVCHILTERQGAAFDTRKLLTPEAIEALSHIFSWKITWPFRDMHRRFGTFDIERQKGLDIPRASIDYQALSSERSRFDAILLCLESVFQSREQLAHAEDLIEAAISRLALAVGLSE